MLPSLAQQIIFEFACAAVYFLYWCWQLCARAKHTKHTSTTKHTHAHANRNTGSVYAWTYRKVTQSHTVSPLERGQHVYMK